MVRGQQPSSAKRAGSDAAHYFDDDPDAVSERRTVELTLPDTSMQLITDRGVFAHGQIDQGSKLLLLRAGAPAATGDLLDLGCGTGAIALTMARRAPAATVWAVDVNRRARELCAENAAANGIDNVRVATPDEVPDDVRMATIWSNPAIRIGKPALHAMLEHWLGRLTDDGTATLVVHKHLGSDSLQRWLVEQHFPTTRLTSNHGYRLLHVHSR